MNERHSKREEQLVDEILAFIEAADDPRAIEVLIEKAKSGVDKAAYAVLSSLREEVEAIAKLRSDTRSRSLGFTPGLRLPGHVLVGLLGSGGLGIVYLAVSLDPPRKVALKVVDSKHRPRDAEELFRREVEAMSALPPHRYIAALYGCGEHEVRFFFTMERIVGSTIDELLVRREFLGLDSSRHLAEVVRIGLQCAQALASAHAIGIHHNDISSHNMAITREKDRPGDALGSVRIFDFGIARLFGDHGTDRFLNPKYAAPERHLGRPGVASADIYSLGLVLIEVLAGRTCVFGNEWGPCDSPLSLLDSRNGHRRRRGIRYRYLRSVLARMTRLNPEGRYQSANDLIDDLRLLESNDRPRSMPPSRIMGAFHFARRNAAALLLAVGLGLALVSSVWLFPRVLHIVRTRNLAQDLHRSGDLRALANLRWELQSFPLHLLLPRTLQDDLAKMRAGSGHPLEPVATALLQGRHESASISTAVTIRDKGLHFDPLLGRWIRRELESLGGPVLEPDSPSTFLRRDLTRGWWERPLTQIASQDIAASASPRALLESRNSRLSVLERTTWICFLGAVGSPKDAVDLMESLCDHSADAEIERASIEAASHIVRRWHCAGRVADVPVVALWDLLRRSSWWFNPGLRMVSDARVPAYERMTITLLSAGRAGGGAAAPPWLFDRLPAPANEVSREDRLMKDLYYRCLAAEDGAAESLRTQWTFEGNFERRRTLARCVGVLDDPTIDEQWRLRIEDYPEERDALDHFRFVERELLRGIALALSVDPESWMGQTTAERRFLLHHEGSINDESAIMHLDFRGRTPFASGVSFVSHILQASISDRESDHYYLRLGAPGLSEIRISIELPSRAPYETYKLDLRALKAARAGFPFEGSADLECICDPELRENLVLTSTSDEFREFGLPVGGTAASKQEVRLRLGSGSTTEVWIKSIAIRRSGPR